MSASTRRRPSRVPAITNRQLAAGARPLAGAPALFAGLFATGQAAASRGKFRRAGGGISRSGERRRLLRRAAPRVGRSQASPPAASSAVRLAARVAGVVGGDGVELAREQPHQRHRWLSDPRLTRSSRAFETFSRSASTCSHARPKPPAPGSISGDDEAARHPIHSPAPACGCRIYGREYT